MQRATGSARQQHAARSTRPRTRRAVPCAAPSCEQEGRSRQGGSGRCTGLSVIHDTETTSRESVDGVELEQASRTASAVCWMLARNEAVCSAVRSAVHACMYATRLVSCRAGRRGERGMEARAVAKDRRRCGVCPVPCSVRTRLRTVCLQGGQGQQGGGGPEAAC